MPSPTLLSILRERASLQPNDAAFTYTDYEQDWAGVAETLTWSQAYRRALNVANEVRRHGSSGDRAVILAPQGLDYIAAFLGAIQAGFIAVPLSVPQVGSHDERVSAVLADTSPSVILTTSAVAPSVTEYVEELIGGAAPTVIEIDALDLNARNGAGPRLKDAPDTAYLQYTSGSTRAPAGVKISDRNLAANFEQLMADYFPDLGGVAPPDTTIVSWLPFYHDMGLMLAVIAPILGGYRAEIMSPVAFLQRPARWVQALASNTHAYSAGPNFAFELAVRKTSDEEMAGLDLGGVLTLVSGAERVHPATLERFVERFSPFGFSHHMMTPSYGMAEATVYVSTRATGGAPVVVDFDPEKLAAGTAERCAGETGSPLISYGVPKSPTVRIVDPDTRTECPAASVGEIWVRGDNVSDGYWNKPEETERTFGGLLVDASARHARRSVAENGGPRFHLRGRAVHRGPHEGPVDRVRAQPLSRGHRGHGPGDHGWPGRGDIGPGGAHGEAGHHHRGEEARRLRRGGHAQAQRRQERRHLRHLEVARPERRGPRVGRTRVDPHHDERQDQTGRVRRPVPAPAVRQIGRLGGPAPPPTRHVDHHPGDGRRNQP